MGDKWGFLSDLELMVDRDQELAVIERYIKTNGVKKGPVAFVCTCIQAHIPDRKFEHSNVESRSKYTFSRMKKKR